MKGPDGSDPSLHARNAALEAEIARLRRTLDEAVRRGVEGSPSTVVALEREIAEGRAALAFAETRLAECERSLVDMKARLASLGLSEARYRLAVESARDYAIFTLDLSGRITGWNTGAENLLGWDEAEAIGRPVNVIFTLEDNDDAIAGGGDEAGRHRWPGRRRPLAPAQGRRTVLG